MFLLHTWLPKAHVEAPVGGSIVLAGVLLKLGAYGLLLFLPYVKINLLLRFYFSIALLGSSVGSLICLRQGDIKQLIAYSSVVHIGVVILGFIRGTEIGYTCGIIIVLAHGLRSPFIFAFSYWLYMSTHSRLMVNNARSWPIATGMILGLVRLNMGVPPCLSLWREVFITIRTLYINVSICPVLIGVFFLGAVYNLYLFTSCMHAKISRVNCTLLEVANVYPVIQVVFFGYSSVFCLDLFHLSCFFLP